MHDLARRGARVALLAAVTLVAACSTNTSGVLHTDNSVSAVSSDRY